LSAARQSKPKLLVVEDDPGLQSQLKWCFEDFDVQLAGDRDTAINAIRRFEPPVVTLDLGLPPDPSNASEGLSLLQEILQLAPDTKIIVVTGNDDRANAVKAVALGAYDFYPKPIDPDLLKMIVSRAQHLHDLESEITRMAVEQEKSPLEGIIAVSPEMGRICEMIERVAPADVSVLLLGESGTGKEVLSNAVHKLSQRKRKPFVVINCAAIPDTLLESELFGYEKGAFTGAHRQHKGKIEAADGGTLFLDEIGDLPQSLQSKLLRFLQERVIERLGGRETIPVNVRVICATNQNLREQITSGVFREDLFYRISEVTIDIPPLRERSGDAVVLAKAFLRRHAGGLNKSLREFTDEALLAIEKNHWHGNARELENRVKRAAIMAKGSRITAADMELEDGTGLWEPLNLREIRERAEKAAIRKSLVMNDHRVAQAAEELGVSRPTLYAMMEKYGLK
jgi:two-component system NtrC family response regulator